MKQHSEIRKTATKLVEVRLSALTRQEYMEVVEVPVDITLIELNNLVQKRYQAVDGGKFTSDPEYWEQSTCEAVDSDMPTAKASLVASRTAEGSFVVTTPSRLGDARSTAKSASDIRAKW